MIHKVAIQGIKGSFHHQVACEYFGEETPLVECMSFDALVESLLQKKASVGIMAIENSIAGSILPNYALIDRKHLRITGEHYLNIHHNLLALPGQPLENIKEVHSHPMALLQCEAFFNLHPHISLVEAADTAEVARRIRDKKLPGIGAIASKMAATLYDLSIIAPEIETINNNATRFVIVETRDVSPLKKEVDKASLKFELDHTRGSLAAVLNVMNDCRLNLTKIQSLPKIETPWKYAFFVDVTFEVYADYEKALKILSIMADDFKILGEYKNARV